MFATRTSRGNEFSETTTLRHQSEKQQHRNINEAIRQQNVMNITGNPLSNQCTLNNNNDSELIKKISTEYDERIIPPYERRETGHTLNPDRENDETLSHVIIVGHLYSDRSLGVCTQHQKQAKVFVVTMETLKLKLITLQKLQGKL